MSGSTAERGDQGQLAGLLARYENVDALLDACAQVRDAGYRQWDALTPFPVHGIEAAMGNRRTRLPWIVFAGGAAGASLGLWLTWWTHAVSYPLVISGKPFFALPAYIPVVFELTVLFAALTAFVSMIALNGLPRPHHPLFGARGFDKVTDDGLFIFVDVADRMFDRVATAKLLEETGALSVEEVRDE